ALLKSVIPYQTDPGEGVFYGPKIDIKFHDAIGRSWQLSTVQVDFNLPEKFDLSFRNTQGEAERPIMIHRALFGSIERFFGILVEHYVGAFPLWLAPEQVMIMTIADRHIPDAQALLERLKSSGIRAEGDFRNEKIGFKIREAQMLKVPEMWIIGDREVAEGRVSIRTREGEKSDLILRDEAISSLIERARPA
ncbi:MAG: His/Gly/Thr/Pro-type tRNA ligase C-terminal domain-containing protein, partial [Leptospirillum sp.]